MSLFMLLHKSATIEEAGRLSSKLHCNQDRSMPVLLRQPRLRSMLSPPPLVLSVRISFPPCTHHNQACLVGAECIITLGPAVHPPCCPAATMPGSNLPRCSQHTLTASLCFWDRPLRQSPVPTSAQATAPLPTQRVRDPQWQAPPQPPPLLPPRRPAPYLIGAWTCCETCHAGGYHHLHLTYGDHRQKGTGTATPGASAPAATVCASAADGAATHCGTARAAPDSCCACASASAS
jgi:hypothetical protein